MRDDNFDPNNSWDEYRWERYLREHDARTDQYIQLLEDHLEDPNREEIIAQEMGWYHLLESHSSLDGQARASLFFEEIEQLLEAQDDDDEDEQDYLEEMSSAPPPFGDSDQFLGMSPLFGSDDEDADFSAEDYFADDDDAEDLEDDDDEFSTHPLCDLAATYQAWLERMFMEEPELMRNPRAIRLAAYSAVCCAKLSAALNGDELDDLGMTIAYLKRGLKAINTALAAYFELRRERILPRKRLADLYVRIFKIRDGIIEVTGYYRQEWMRRIDD
jgi:hypothetical protein